MTKKKADCTPEEWAQIRARARQYDAKQRQKPERHAYMKQYMDTYTKTPEYREKDNARYGDARRANQLRRYRLRAYKLTDRDIQELLSKQRGRCGVCLRVLGESRTKGGQTPYYVDHCHLSGLVRGLLCPLCNTIEGFITKLGMTPEQYGGLMQAYLNDPPRMRKP